MRSLEEFFNIECIFFMLFDGIWGDRLVCAIQPVSFAICKNISAVIPSGLFTSKTTSPVASSQNSTVIRISFGNILLMALRASSSESLMDGSVLIMNLFFIDFERAERWRVNSVSANDGFLV